MTSSAEASAVVIIETDEFFLTEGRPTISGALAYSGKIQLFGGGTNGEPPEVAICRELEEELDLYLETPPHKVWQDEVDSQNKKGEPVRRHVTLFRLVLESEIGITHKTPGTIERIPKTRLGVEAHQDRLTSFAFESLIKALEYEPDQSWNDDTLAANT